MKYKDLVITTAPKLRKFLTKNKSKCETVAWRMLMGSYNSRIFGICVYREGKSFKNDLNNILKSKDKTEQSEVNNT